MRPSRPLPAEARLYQTGSWLCFDFETTNLEKGSPLNPQNRVVLGAWVAGTPGKRGPVRDFQNPLEAADFWRALEEADYLICHNAKFEAGWLIRLGYDPTQKRWLDTLIAEKVRLGNRRAPLDLGSVSHRYGYKGKEELIDSLLKTGVCPSDMPQDLLLARCRRDVLTTAQVAGRQVAGLAKEGKLAVLATRCLLTPILAQIEATGMCLDPARVDAEYAKYVAEAAKLEAEMREATGGINARSSDQMAAFLYETLKFPERKDKRGRPLRNQPSKRWPGGKPRTDAATLDWLKSVAKTKRQREFIALRERYGKVVAALSKNLEFFKGVAVERGGIFYGQFSQVNTGTHRLSSMGRPQSFLSFKGEKSVQFQNMPRDFKRLFRARDPEYRMVEADGSQLEFRVAAFLGQDRQAMLDIHNKVDIHRFTASILNEVPEAEVTPEQRQEAKADTFKPLYGGRTGTPAQERYYAEFQRKYSDLYAEQERWVSEVMGRGRLVTPWGLRFYWDFYMDRNGQPIAKDTHKSIVPAVFNYPVQSLATAEIIPIAVVKLYQAVRKAGLRVLFVNTIHDSVVAEVHHEDVDAYKGLVVWAFTQGVYGYLWEVYGLRFNVPLGCEIKVGTHWGEGKDVTKAEVNPPEYKEAA